MINCFFLEKKSKDNKNFNFSKSMDVLGTMQNKSNLVKLFQYPSEEQQ